jgi:hypothetical protein
MVKVKPAPMLKLLAVPGATPVPTVKDPPDPLKETLLLSRTGLLVRLLIVTAEVIVGTPADQLPAVPQTFETAPLQVSEAA